MNCLKAGVDETRAGKIFEKLFQIWGEKKKEKLSIANHCLLSAFCIQSAEYAQLSRRIED